MVEIGDKVLVFAAGSDYATAVPLWPPEVGDNVALYNLKNETRIAVPTLTFALGDFAFVTPNFDFAGFDFKLDFNMQLIPLILGFNITPDMYHDFHAHITPIGGGASFDIYGDGTDCHTVRLNYGYKYSGKITFVFVDVCDGTLDSVIEARAVGSQLEIWAYPIGGFMWDHKLYYKSTLLTEGNHLTMPEYHGFVDI